MLNIIAQLFPEPIVIAVVSPLTVACICLFLFISGTLKRSYNIKTNYTRKLFHILVFSMAGVIGFLFNFQAVMLFGGISGLIIIYVIYLGEGNLFYEAIAREQDDPHRSFYIGVPFITTAIAGLFNNLLFGQIALVGYLVAGWGDAIGEPVGVRFGKHRYPVPSLKQVKCTRSVEGSVAIMLMSFVGASVALIIIGIAPLHFVLIVGLLAGLATALVEAVSPHGIDNFTTQVSATAICFYVLMIL